MSHRAESVVDDDVSAVEALDDDRVWRVIENALKKALALAEVAHRRRRPLICLLQRIALRFLHGDVARDGRHADDTLRHWIANQEMRIEDRDGAVGSPVSECGLTGPFAL
jgi:hypothetical protein